MSLVIDSLPTAQFFAGADEDEMPDLSGSVLDLAPVALYVCDRDGLIVRYNRRAAELWGREPCLRDPSDRFCGSLRLHRLDGGPLPHAECPMSSVLKTGVPVREQEVIVERPDGSRIIAQVSIEAMRDASGTITGAINCFTDVTGRRQVEQQQDLLLREMVHRVRNLFSLVSGMIALSTRSAETPQQLAQALQARLGALSRAHELTLPRGAATLQKGARGTTLDSLLRAIVSPHLPSVEPGNGRIVARGPEVEVGSHAITSLALLLHELATNASKYGALSKAEGRVDVIWETSPAELRLTWAESGGPALDGSTPSEGFGSLLAHQTVTSQFQGHISREWRREGLRVQLTARLERLRG